MLLVRVVLLLWLKLIVPVPEPKAMVAAVTVPAESLAPKRPILSVPVEPLDAAIVIPVAETSPPLATVSVPLPLFPKTMLPPDQRELVPVTSTELFEDVELLPMFPDPITVPASEMTRLLPDPLLPTLRTPEFDQRELVPVTSTELFEDVELLPMVPALLFTVPPLEMTRLLPDPLLPTLRVVLFVQSELLPVTSTELFEDEELLPMFPALFLTVPPLEMTRLLPAPLWPTKRVVTFDQTELLPVTKTELFEPTEAKPMVPALFFTVPPLEMVRLLLAPALPTVKAPEFDQKELVPVTSTELFEDVELLPMVPAVFCTVPPSEMTSVLPDPLLPTLRVELFVQSELLPVTSTRLFEDEELLPMVPALFFTMPPLEMVKLLPDPM